MSDKNDELKMFQVPEISTTKILGNACIAGFAIGASVYAGVKVVEGICSGIGYLTGAGSTGKTSDAVLTIG